MKKTTKKKQVYGAACFMAAEIKFSEDVRLSVCPSHLFFYVPIIVSSWNSQELLPWTKVMSIQKVKVKGQGHKCLKKFYVLYHSSNQNVFENNYISQGHKYFVVDVTWTLFHIHMFLVVLAVHIYYFTFSWLSISWQVFLFMALHVYPFQWEPHIRNISKFIAQTTLESLASLLMNTIYVSCISYFVEINDCLTVFQIGTRMSCQ